MDTFLLALMDSHTYRLCSFFALFACASSVVIAAETNSEPPPHIAVLGDSITYDRRWVTLVESALRASPKYAQATIVNFGVPSETASGLSEAGHAGGAFPRPVVHERLARVLAAFKPTLVLACYGMNDGIYQPLEAARFKAFQDGMTKLKSAVEKSGATFITITPPLHAADKPATDPNRYDAVLDAYAAWLVDRRADGWKVIDIRPGLKKSLADAKRANPKFVYSGDDVHPGAEGHELIARAAWPDLANLLDLPKTPEFAAGAALAILTERQALLRDAWLHDTGHLRPGVAGYRPPGVPIPEATAVAAATAKADRLLAEYRQRVAAIK